MWDFLSAIATLFTGLAAASTLSENLSKAQQRREAHRALRRGMILPKDAAKALEARIGGRVVVGRDREGDKLVVLRSATSDIPATFGGYRVGFRPRL